MKERDIERRREGEGGKERREGDGGERGDGEREGGREETEREERRGRAIQAITFSWRCAKN